MILGLLVLSVQIWIHNSEFFVNEFDSYVAELEQYGSNKLIMPLSNEVSRILFQILLSCASGIFNLHITQTRALISSKLQTESMGSCTDGGYRGLF